MKFYMFVFSLPPSGTHTVSLGKFGIGEREHFCFPLSEAFHVFSFAFKTVKPLCTILE